MLQMRVLNAVRNSPSDPPGNPINTESSSSTFTFHSWRTPAPTTPTSPATINPKLSLDSGSAAPVYGLGMLAVCDGPPKVLDVPLQPQSVTVPFLGALMVAFIIGIEVAWLLLLLLLLVTLPAMDTDTGMDIDVADIEDIGDGMLTGMMLASAPHSPNSGRHVSPQ